MLKVMYYILFFMNVYGVLTTPSVFMGITCSFFATFWFYMICSITLKGE